MFVKQRIHIVGPKSISHDLKIIVEVFEIVYLLMEIVTFPFSILWSDLISDSALSICPMRSVIFEIFYLPTGKF